LGRSRGARPRADPRQPEQAAGAALSAELGAEQRGRAEAEGVAAGQRLELVPPDAARCTTMPPEAFDAAACIAAVSR
jgi:hypothetical protein